MNLRARLSDIVTRARNSPEFRKSLTYVTASAIGFGIVFIQNFSLAYFTSLAFFGQITLIISLFSTLYVIFTFGMNAVILRFFFDDRYSADPKNLINYVASIWLYLGGSLAIVLLIGGYFISKELLPVDYQTEFIPVLFAAFLFSVTEIFPNYYVVSERPLRYARWLIGTRLLIFIMLHIGIFALGESSKQVAYMLLFSASCLFIWTIIEFRIYSVRIPEKGQVSDIIKYALPLMFYALGGIGYSHGYRVVISSLLNYENLAIFGMANQITMVYYLLASSSITGLQPRAYRSLAETQGNPSSIRFYLKTLLFLGLSLALVIGPAGYLFLLYFKDSLYVTAYEAVPILIVGQFIYLLYSYNYILCTFYKKTKILTYAMAAGVTTSLLLAMAILRDGELWQAAVPVLAGIIVQFIVSFVLMTKERNMKSQTPDPAGTITK